MTMFPPIGACEPTPPLLLIGTDGDPKTSERRLERSRLFECIDAPRMRQREMESTE